MIVDEAVKDSSEVGAVVGLLRRPRYGALLDWCFY